MVSTLEWIRNKAPVPLPSTGGVLSLTSGTNPSTQSLEAMGAAGTLFAIVNRCSNAVSQVNWRLWRTNDRDDERVEVHRHPALSLWNRPNPTTGRQQFVEGTQQHIELTGEGWWVIGRNPASTMPLELWYIRPDKMSPVVEGSELRGYMYRGPRGQKVPLTTDQVIQMKMPNPMDMWRGMGPVQAILTELDSYRFTAEWNRNFFRNSAEPGGVIQTDGQLSDPEWEQLVARWQEQHKGVSNAHRVAVLEGGAKWVGNQMTMRDMQFAELREVSRDTIREAFGFPKSMLGAADDVNRANAEAGAAVFAEWLVVPRLQRIKSALNMHLLPMFGADDQLEFDYDNPVPASASDERQKLNADSLAAQRLVNAGYDPADVLETLGLRPMGYVGPPHLRAQSSSE